MGGDSLEPFPLGEVELRGRRRGREGLRGESRGSCRCHRFPRNFPQLSHLKQECSLILLELLLHDAEVRVERSDLCLEVLIELCPRALLRRRDGLDLRAQSDHFRAQFGNFFLGRHG